jgi:predicted lipoprotein
MKILTISLLCLTLTACCPEALVKKAPNFDARLMEECTELVTPTISSFSDVIEAKASDTKAYIKCKNTHSGLVEAIKVYQKEFNK